MKFSVATEQIGADLSKVVDRVVKQYENFPNAFQKEAIQNAWDVRLDRKEGSAWKINIYTYNEGKLTHLIIEDFGTYGMNKERWEAFLSLWKPKKEYLDAGGQGQGKFVLMRASGNHILIVESISDEMSYQCKFLQNDQKSEENQQYSIKDFISGVQPLNHKGTRIWIYNVEKEFLKIICSKEFSESIIESWWQLLGRRFNAKVYLFDKEINLLELPSPVEEIILLENKQLENFGRTKRLILMFYKEPIPEIFRGIRIQRANMMITKIPFEVYEKEYQGRFSGYIEFDKDLEKNLKDIEKTDHGGFLFELPWKEIKNVIRDEAEKFVNKIIPKKEKIKTPEFKNLNKVIQRANQIISDACPEIIGGGMTEPPPPKPPLPLRIKYLTIHKREVKYGDIIKPHCGIVNETGEDKKILLKVRLKRMGNKISEEGYKLKINGKDQKSIKLTEIKLEKEHYPKGKYTIRATIEENRHDIDTRATSFYLETKREKIKRGFIRLVEFFDSEEPIRNKPINKGVVKINLAHNDFLNILNSFREKERIKNQQIEFYIIKICLDEAVNELYKLKLKDLENIELDELVKEVSQIRDKMYYDIYA